MSDDTRALAKAFNDGVRSGHADIIGRLKRHAGMLRHEADVARMPEPRDDEPPDAYEDVFARVSEAFQVPATQERSCLRQQRLEAIEALPADERAAVILVYIMGYKAESIDPDEETAATRCNCTGRTIRNRLTRAAAKLAPFKEDL